MNCDVIRFVKGDVVMLIGRGKRRKSSKRCGGEEKCSPFPNSLQTLEPKAEETVVDNVSCIRPVEKVAFRQLGCG